MFKQYFKNFKNFYIPRYNFYIQQPKTNLTELEQPQDKSMTNRRAVFSWL